MSNDFAERVLKCIEKIAPFYAPEWKLDRNCSDAGSALATIFARQTGQSMQKFHETPQKHKLALYSLLGEDVLPARPGEGLVYIKPQNSDGEGQHIKKGFKLYACDTDGARLAFEITDDIFMTSSNLIEMILSDCTSDSACFWEGGNTPFVPVRQKIRRYFEFSHEYFSSGLPVFVRVKGADELLGNPTNATPYYISTGGTKLSMECAVTKEDGLMPEGMVGTANAVGFDIINVDAFEGIAFEGITVAIKAEDIIPTVIANGEMQSDVEFYPFGKDFVPCDDVAFFCQALGIKGAQLTLKFDVSMDIRKTEEIVPPPLPPRKFIISKKSIPKTKVHDVFVESVEWEYYNGFGFVPLILKSSARQVFSQNAGGTYTLEFATPEDIATVLLGSVQGYCVRARISGIHNAWKRPARVFLPRISNVRVCCKTPPVKISGCKACSGGEVFSLTDISALKFSRLHPDKQVLYLGFDKPLSGGKINLFAECSGGGNARWEYLAQSGWKELDAEDDTDAFFSCGLISFNIRGSTSSAKIFGRTAHWIRAVFNNKCLPILNRIFVNAVAVRQSNKVINETYYADKNGTVKLKYNNISEETVFVGKDFERKAVEGVDYRMDRADGIIHFAAELKREAGFAFRIDCKYGGGANTNLAAHSEFSPAFSAGNIGAIINPLPLLGGSERESMELASIRIGKCLRNSNRCVTARDYLDIIEEPEIVCADCITTHGKITLVVLIKNHFDAYAFNIIRRRALNRIGKLSPIGAPKIDIIQPVFVPISVRTELAVQNNFVLSDAHEVMNKLCNPLARMQAFGAGDLPGAEEIRRALVALPTVTACYSLFVLNESETSSYALPVAGSYELKLVHS